MNFSKLSKSFKSFCKPYNSSTYKQKIKGLFKSGFILASSYLITKTIINQCNKNILYSKENKEEDFSHLPTFTRKQISEHFNKDTGIWVSYKDGVYDITNFLKYHPGGESKLLLAAGGAIEPFWAMYTFHKDSELAMEMLKKHRIGNLHANDIMKESDIPDFSSMRKEKIENRSKSLNKLLSFPYCAESPEDKLSDHFYTPAELFFVRNHNTIPEKISLKEYEIDIQFPVFINPIKYYSEYFNFKFLNNSNDDNLNENDVSKSLRLYNFLNNKTSFKEFMLKRKFNNLFNNIDTSADHSRSNEDEEEEFDEDKIKNFNDDMIIKSKSVHLMDLLNKIPSQKRTTIVACAGLRRSSMKYKDNKTKGLQWKSGAIANGIWEGLLLRDVLEYMGYDKNDLLNESIIDKLHLQCEGADKDFQNEHYRVSIPLKDALDQALLAVKYNGEDIPFDHGYPLRFIVPGFVGVRNVKWVKKIIISEKESAGPYQQRDYKIIPIDKNPEDLDLSKIDPVYKWNINSAVMFPMHESFFNKNEIEKDIIRIKGWAFGTYGSEINKIELSFDEGETWKPVDDKKFDVNPDGKIFGWTKWHYDLSLKDYLNKADKNKKIESVDVSVWVRAFDKDGNEQPIDNSENFNFRGIMNNSYHKINFNLI